MKEKLLRLIEKNARFSNAKLATMLGVTEAEVAKAIGELEQDGVIRGYTALIDWEKQGSNAVSALIELRVTPKRDMGFDDTARTVMAFEEVESVYLMSGGYDFLVEVHGRSFQEIAMFVAKRLSTLDSVISTTTHFLLSRYKESGIIMSGEEQGEGRSMVL